MRPQLDPCWIISKGYGSTCWLSFLFAQTDLHQPGYHPFMSSMCESGQHCFTGMWKHLSGHVCVWNPDKWRGLFEHQSLQSMDKVHIDTCSMNEISARLAGAISRNHTSVTIKIEIIKMYCKTACMTLQAWSGCHRHESYTTHIPINREWHFEFTSLRYLGRMRIKNWPINMHGTTR